MLETPSIRSAGRVAALILEEAAVKRQQSINIERDRDWLEGLTSDPNSALERMSALQLLYRVGRGRYVVAPRGTFTAQQAAPKEMLAVLGAVPTGTDYFVSFLSALIKCELTDVHSGTTYIAIPQKARAKPGRVVVPSGGEVQLVRLSASRWPKQPDREISSVRVLGRAKDAIRMATVERALVDSLSRPELSGGIETVVTAWARALRRNTDWKFVCEIAAGIGGSAKRRTAFLLGALGLQDVMAEQFPGLTGRGTEVPFDRSKGFELEPADWPRDRATGVLINTPPGYLEGWISAAEIA
jgi:predicted transcriptional regulator of viral defense system